MTYGLLTLNLGEKTKGPKNPHDTPKSKYEMVAHPNNRGVVVVDGHTLEAGTSCDCFGNLCFVDFLAEEDGDRVFWSWKEK